MDACVAGTLWGLPDMKRTALLIMMVVLTLSALAYLLWWDSQNASVHFLSAFLMTQPLLLGVFALIAWRSRLLSHGQISWPISVRANGLVYLGMWLVPARLSEFLKPFYFKKQTALPYADGLALTVKERVWDVVGFGSICVIGAFVAFDQVLFDDMIIRVSGVFVLAVLSFYGLYVLPFIIRAIPFLKRFETFARALASDSWRDRLIQFVLSLTLWVGSLGLMVIFYGYSGLPTLSFMQLLVLFLVASLGLAVTVTPAGVGTYEAAIIAVLANYNVPFADALAFAIGFRFSWMAVPTLLGGYALIRDGFDVLSVKEGEHG